MKTISKIKCMLTCLLLCIGGNLWAQDVFVKVTSLDELKNNDEVIFVKFSKDLAMSTSQGTSRGVVETINKEDVCKLPNNTNIQVLKVRVEEQTISRKKYTLYAFHTGNGFLYHPSTKSELFTNQNSFSSTFDSKELTQWWTLKLTSGASKKVDGQIELKNFSSSKYLQYYDNSFTCTSGTIGGTDPLMYKKVSSSDLQTRAVKNSLGTICLNRKATISGTAYSVAGKVISNNEPTSIVLKEVGSVIEAGVPYIYYTKDTELLIAMSGNEVSSATTSNGLIGTFASVKIQNNTDFYCILTQNKLAHCGTDCVVGAYKAYFDLRQMDEYTPSGAKPRFILTQDGVVDAIEALPSSSDPPAIYSITGTKTTQLTKGINIVKHTDGTVTKVLKR